MWFVKLLFFFFFRLIADLATAKMTSVVANVVDGYRDLMDNKSGEI